eukprot:UN04308
MHAQRIAPQEMPPEGGFQVPKYRMQTLLHKGFSPKQCAAGFVGLMIFGFYAFNRTTELLNAKRLVEIQHIDAQSRLNRMLYGPPQSIGVGLGNATRNRKRSQHNWQKRNELFINSIAADEAKLRVDQWRQATTDPLAAGYKVCYGPENYVHEHVCTEKCIHPDEIKTARKKYNIKFPDQLSQKQGV